MENQTFRPDTPLVSCICSTNNSLDLLSRSINCFVHQTYPAKELVVVYMSDNHETAAFLKTITDSTIIPLEIPASSKVTLGEKRNLAIEKGKGFYFCVWDDDDWYHNSRIEFHVDNLRNSPYRSSVLTSVLVYDEQNGKAYLSGTRWAWEQTLLCEKSVFGNPELRYAELAKGEDSVLVFNLREHDLLKSTTNPALYIYVYHGKNTWHRRHWAQNILAHGKPLSEIKSKTVRDILSNKYSHEEASSLLMKLVHQNA